MVKWNYFKFSNGRIQPLYLNALDFFFFFLASHRCDHSYVIEIQNFIAKLVFNQFPSVISSLDEKGS